jgi:ABC-type phosphate/phosphonate transport system substrate-binding protein
MRIKWLVLLFLTMSILAACGSFEEPPTRRPPTITPTPLSTELPVVETAIPVGFSVDNPIQLVIVPADPDAAEAGLDEFESILQSLTNVSINVVLADSQLEAYAAVCASSSGTVSAAWLDGMTFAANDLAGCGIGALQADTPDGTGETGVLLVNIEYEEDGIEATVDETLCRIAANDLFSWVLPVLFYGNEGFTVADIDDINELEDNDALIEALASGQCAAVGMSETTWEAYLDADEEGTLEENVVIAATSPEIPYHVFSFSVSLSLDAITDIQSALLQMDILAGRSDVEVDPESTEEAPEQTGDLPEVDADLMAAFFGDGSLMAVDTSDFEELFAFFEACGIDFAELDN